MKKKKLLALFLGMSVMSMSLFTGCGSDDDWDDDWDDEFWEEDEDEVEENRPQQSTSGVRESSGEVSLSLSTENTGELTITRYAGTMDQGIPMGEEGTWTIFVYLCGSDLESENGMGSMDMEEMMSASTTENVKFVVQTGGSYEWQNGVDADKTQRYVICDGDAELVDELPDANMADPNTLSGFLKWGVTNYAAANMGVILWNHGGGSIMGVCLDERTDNMDTLTLRELDAAFLSVRDLMTEKFEFIGCDACLMATLETANVFANYANYMFASEETEPGYGWDYEAIGDYLGKYNEANGAELGKVVVDSFYSCCEQIDEEAGATLSVTDLSRLDAVLISFNNFAQGLHELGSQGDGLTRIVRNSTSVDNFGGNNKSEGYTNMVDLVGFVKANAGEADGAQDVLKNIENAVIYSVNGSDHRNAGGLSMYYPIQIQGTTELSTFREIATSQYYLGLVDLVAYGAANAGDISNYEENYDGWGDYSYESDDDGYYSYEFDEDDTYGYYDDVAQTGESSLITFEEEPYLDDEGYYTFVLDENGLNNAVMVEAYVYQLSADEEDFICLGITTDVVVDWETGEVYDMFDGSWFSLPDGQNLCAYIVDETEDYAIYTSPVRVNGKDTNLRFTVDYNTGKISIDGTWDGIGESGMAARDVKKLKAGDVIVPVYDAMSASMDSDEEFIYTGFEYTYQNGDVITYQLMDDADYIYGYYIDDTYGDYYMTDYVWFAVEDGEVYYYVDEE